ncbi:hypothetical protein T484DRAFT_1962931 [Baffinella frigidus]|nr:hypothetical protein T484DRAFT_1962931 [Cryptophyta sp. CCMP2293]
MQATHRTRPVTSRVTVLFLTKVSTCASAVRESPHTVLLVAVSNTWRCRSASFKRCSIIMYTGLPSRIFPSMTFRSRANTLPSRGAL